MPNGVYSKLFCKNNVLYVAKQHGLQPVTIKLNPDKSIIFSGDQHNLTYHQIFDNAGEFKDIKISYK